MNGARFLVDTNVLVYAYDRSEYAKQRRARAVLAWLNSRSLGLLSTQVLGEFFWVLTRKLVERRTAQEARAHVERYIQSWKIASLTSTIILESARGAAEHGLPFYDAQLWATARLNHIPIVVSEDFSSGSHIEGVEFMNPFISSLPGEE